MSGQLGFLVLLVTLFATGESICPDGFCRHSGGCYMTAGLRVSWIDAWYYCKVFNASLMMPTDTEMQASAEGILQKAKGTIKPGNVWLGFTDLKNPREWKDMMTSLPLTYTHFAPGLGRNGSLDQNCVYMSSKDDYMWKISSCTARMNFICYSSGLMKYEVTDRGRYYSSGSRYYYKPIPMTAGDVHWTERNCNISPV